MKDTTPILVGSGQVVLRSVDTAEIASANSPVSIAAQAVNRALVDTACPEILPRIDTLAMVRLFIDSARVFKHPFGSSNVPPLSVARRVGVAPSRLIYGTEGGQSPQRLVNELAHDIQSGATQAAVLCGAEATGVMKKALRNQWALDWSEHIDASIDDRGYRPLQNELERSHGITFPPQVYALLENAWRYRHGLSLENHTALMANLFSRFSRIAEKNPYSQFPVACSKEFLATTSDENYQLNIPYNKWFVAQDAVNQGAAVIVTSVAVAKECGIPESQWVYLHGYGDADDSWVSERRDLSRSEAMSLAMKRALKSSKLQIESIGLLDIYSCFPVAVLAACESLGLDWDSGRSLTVTGGLPFFGGAGNNYSLHAIAEMTSRLRASPGAFGLVSANGGYLSKHSVGVYSTTAPDHDDTPLKKQGISIDTVPGRVEMVPEYTGSGTIESYSVVITKQSPVSAFIVGRCADTSKRFMAVVGKGDSETLSVLSAKEPIGRKVNVVCRDHLNYFSVES